MATLDDVLVTDELARRPSRAPDYRAEAAAIARLAETAARQPRDALQCLTDIIVGMDMAESAGVTLRVPGTDPARCTWRAVSGAWRDYVGQTLRLDQTPCGVVMARDTALLFHDPGGPLGRMGRSERRVQWTPSVPTAQPICCGSLL